MNRSLSLFAASLLCLHSGAYAEIKVDDGNKAGAKLPSDVTFPLGTVDLADDTTRQVVVERGTDTVYNGQPTTLLLPDGKTMFATWSYDHGGVCGPLKRSTDAGKTWSPLLDVPASWRNVFNGPSIYRLTDPQGKSRLLVFAARGPDGTMQRSISEDDGKTWSEMEGNGLVSVVPFTTILPIDGGKKLLGLTNIRRPGETKEKRSNVIAQSTSEDGGLTWAPWRIVADLPGLVPCEPALIRSPDGRQLLCLMRENSQRWALYMTSDDDGKTWTEPKRAPIALAGDRHVAKYAPDGRLVICFRDRANDSGTLNNFVAWVGKYDDIKGGGEGQYRIKLLTSHAGRDCGYPGVELLPDGTFVATTYIKYRPGTEKHSIVSTRFTLAETDKLEAKKLQLLP